MTTDDDLRARVVDIQQTVDRLLADTTPAPVGTSGSADSVEPSTVTRRARAAAAAAAAARRAARDAESAVSFACRDGPSGPPDVAPQGRVAEDDFSWYAQTHGARYRCLAVPLRAVPPMMAVSAKTLPVGADWTYEVKWDGYRAQAIKDGSHRLAGLAKPEEHHPAVSRRLPPPRPGVDANDGAARRRDRRARRRRAPVVSGAAPCRFQRPLDRLLRFRSASPERTRSDARAARRAARGAARAWSPGPACCCPIRCRAPPHEIAARGPAISGWRASSPSAAGRRTSPGRRSDSWVKVRFAQHQEFVVGGYKPSATNFDSLLVGYYDKTKLLAPARCAAASRRTCARRCSSSSGGWRRRVVRSRTCRRRGAATGAKGSPPRR